MIWHLKIQLQFNFDQLIYIINKKSRFKALSSLINWNHDIIESIHENTRPLSCRLKTQYKLQRKINQFILLTRPKMKKKRVPRVHDFVSFESNDRVNTNWFKFGTRWKFIELVDLINYWIIAGEAGKGVWKNFPQCLLRKWYSVTLDTRGWVKIQFKRLKCLGIPEFNLIKLN